MLDEGALVISFPAPEWKSVRPKGSVFARSDIPRQTVSPPLVRALDLVASACGHSGFEPVFVARPEIFTGGESLRWLMSKLGPVRDHLCFSDGATIKLIPGLRNHVFFYGLARSADSEALNRLNHRFPEVFNAVRSQVNSALRLGSSGDGPAPIAIEGATETSHQPVFYPVALHFYSPSESLRRTLLGRPLAQLPGDLDELTYIALTEASLKDADFIKSIAEVYDATYFASGRGLVLRVPERIGASSDLEDRLEASLAALVEGGSRAPLAPARNAWMASDDVPAATLASAARAASFWTHDTFDFWRAAPTDYQVFQSRKIFADRDRNMSRDFEHLVEALCGPSSEVVGHNLTGEVRL